MGERAEEEGTVGLEAPPRPLPAELPAADAAGADRRARSGVVVARLVLAAERAGVSAEPLELELVLPAAGRAAGAAWAGDATVATGTGAAAALTTGLVTAEESVDGGDVEGTAAGALLEDPAAAGVALAEAAGADAGAEPTAGLELLLGREVRLAIAQVGRG